MRNQRRQITLLHSIEQCEQGHWATAILLSYLLKVVPIAKAAMAQVTERIKKTFPSLDSSPPLSACWIGKKATPMAKFKTQFKARPTLPAAFKAWLGITSGRTTHVTGPSPTEKATTKRIIPTIERPEALVLMPNARSKAAKHMIEVGKTRRRLLPSRCHSVGQYL